MHFYSSFSCHYTRLNSIIMWTLMAELRENLISSLVFYIFLDTFQILWSRLLNSNNNSILMALTSDPLHTNTHTSHRKSKNMIQTYFWRYIVSFWLHWLHCGQSNGRDSPFKMQLLQWFTLELRHSTEQSVWFQVFRHVWGSFNHFSCWPLCENDDYDDDLSRQPNGFTSSGPGKQEGRNANPHGSHIVDQESANGTQRLRLLNSEIQMPIWRSTRPQSAVIPKYQIDVLRLVFGVSTINIENKKRRTKIHSNNQTRETFKF